MNKTAHFVQMAQFHVDLADNVFLREDGVMVGLTVLTNPTRNTVIYVLLRDHGDVQEQVDALIL